MFCATGLLLAISNSQTSPLPSLLAAQTLTALLLEHTNAVGNVSYEPSINILKVVFSSTRFLVLFLASCFAP